MWKLAGGVTALVMALSSHAAFGRDTVNIDITSYYTGNWSDNKYNGSQIASASKHGNARSGLTFSYWSGQYVEAGPDGGNTGGSLTINISPVDLDGNDAVNTLINTFYGVGDKVNATITFTNDVGQTAEFSLVGDQTVRDFNNNIFTNDLQGYNTKKKYGEVTAQNWWNNGADGQRLDAQTFVLPSSWKGTRLSNVEIVNPYTVGNTDDVILSAMQVASQHQTR